MTKVNSGNDGQARMMGGDVVGTSGTSTAAGATSLTDSGASWTTNAYIGHIVSTGTVYGIVTANSGTVLTVDRWYTPATPGGAAASTPSTGQYVVSPGNAPAWYVALTANNSAASAGDTSLTGEIVTSGGALVRKIAPYAHTAGAASYTLTPVFTANGSDSLPVTIAKIGVFQSIVANLMIFETLLSATATLSQSGDQLTVTETVSL